MEGYLDGSGEHLNVTICHGRHRKFGIGQMQIRRLQEGEEVRKQASSECGLRE
jgi:hypothetical protein